MIYMWTTCGSSRCIWCEDINDIAQYKAAYPSAPVPSFSADLDQANQEKLAYWKAATLPL